jgi:nitrate reductase NapE component
LAGTVEEMRQGTWAENARQRSSRRKSPWNLLLLLIFPLWGVLWWLTVLLGGALHFALHRQSLLNLTDWMHVLLVKPITGATALLVLGPMIPALTGAMVLGNFLVWLIPPARRAMQEEDRPHPGTDYATAQRTLGRLTLYTLPFAALLMLCGVLLLP